MLVKVFAGHFVHKGVAGGLLYSPVSDHRNSGQKHRNIKFLKRASPVHTSTSRQIKVTQRIQDKPHLVHRPRTS